ncbi:NAD(P)-dependent oxidoreductase [Streptosporangiaceae bacterium NEAU-GS5]|nr:NAD(P)-dependent oxidoreductase [Streptosporangiaceae bacterium NEAU-GS5]
MIAFLGLGHMGAPMARQLIDAGHERRTTSRRSSTSTSARVIPS